VTDRAAEIIAKAIDGLSFAVFISAVIRALFNK